MGCKFSSGGRAVLTAVAHLCGVMWLVGVCLVTLATALAALAALAAVSFFADVSSRTVAFLSTGGIAKTSEDAMWLLAIGTGIGFVGIGLSWFACCGLSHGHPPMLLLNSGRPSNNAVTEESAAADGEV
jgi:hypothetical protein